MKSLLVIGNGGREHALAWKLAQSEHVKEVFVAPGNAGTALEANIHNIPIQADDIAHLVKFAKENEIFYTVVGPEAPLVAGIVDTFQKHGLKIFGPTAKAAQLEGSKAFAKAFLDRHNIPTASYAEFTEANAARAYLQTQTYPIVIKADGLAAGKGVVIAKDLAEAERTVDEMLISARFGEASAKIVIEEFLQGEEASFIVMLSGDQVVPMATSQDHKARDNQDKGPNTGGMGAYSPAPVVDDELFECIMTTVIKPTVEGLVKDELPYTGFLYAGLMIDSDGIPKVLEFNCRFGDPETQPIMMRLKSDLFELIDLALNQSIKDIEIDWSDQTALGVVMASGGYPDSYETKHVIEGLDTISDMPEQVKVFHAGTSQKGNHVITAGGRVLCVTALGEDIIKAQQNAYKGTEKIHWEGAFYRTDIGYRAIERQK